MANAVLRDEKIKKLVTNMVVLGQSQLSLVFWGKVQCGSCQKRLYYLTRDKTLDRIEINEEAERYVYYKKYLPKDYEQYLLRNELLIAWDGIIKDWTKHTIQLSNGRSIYITPVIQETDVLAMDILDSPQIIIFKNQELLQKLCNRFPYETYPQLMLTCPSIIRATKEPVKCCVINKQGELINFG